MKLTQSYPIAEPFSRNLYYQSFALVHKNFARATFSRYKARNYETF